MNARPARTLMWESVWQSKVHNYRSFCWPFVLSVVNAFMRHVMQASQNTSEDGTKSTKSAGTATEPLKPSKARSP